MFLQTRFVHLLFFPLALVQISSPAEPADFQWVQDKAGESFALRGNLTLGTRGRGRGQVELALHDRGDGRRLELHMTRSRARLVNLQAKNWEVVAEGEMPQLSGRPAFQVFRDSWRLLLVVEGRRVLHACEASHEGGRIGVRQTGGGLGLEAMAYQPCAPIYFTDDFTRLPGETGEWQVLSGAFRLHRTDAHKYDERVYSANAFRWESSGKGIDLAWAGQWFWRNYHLAASVRPEGEGAVGLCVWLQGPGNAMVFRCETGRRAQRSRWVRVVGGREEVLAEAELPLESGQWYRLEVRAVDRHLEARVDGQTVAIAEVDEWLSGGVGIMSEGCSACFDDVRVVSLEGYHENFAGRVFNTQPITLQGLEKGRLMVFGGPSWQDARCQVEPVSGRTGSYCILYGLSHPTTPGYLHIAQKGDHISLTLQRKKSDGVAVLGEARLDGLPSRIGIELNGRRVRVLADGQEALRAEDTEATGGRMGLAWKPSRYLPFQRVNAELPVESEAAPAVHPQFVQEATMQEWSTSQVARRVVTWNLSESSPGVLIDDTFSAAPVHWWVGRGSWNIIPRWPCDDRWSWLGGVASESPVLWTKYRLEGDVILDAWVAPFMDNPEDPVIGYSHPGNLNVTLCGDGRNLSSGYSFLFAARNNTTSQILRKEKVVAENRAICMVDPRRTNLAFQRHWFHLRIEKAGARLKYFVDGVQALEFMDSEPLSGGQAAFWSWQAGLMVARVRLSAQGAVVAVRPSLPALEAPEGTRGWKALRIPPGLACSFEKGTGGWESDNSTGEAEVGIRHEGPRPYLCVKNLVSGGAFRLQSPIQHYDSSRFPRLAFQFRADPGVRVNLQAKANGNPVVIPLTAGAEAGSEAAVLPAAAVSADGQWHAVRYDVAGALRARFPSIASLMVSDLEFSAPLVEYLRSGIGGNGYGCEYHLAEFCLEGQAELEMEEMRRVLPKDYLLDF